MQVIKFYYMIKLLMYFNKNKLYLQNLCGGYFTIGFSCKRHHMLWKKILTKGYKLCYPKTHAKKDKIMNNLKQKVSQCNRNSPKVLFKMSVLNSTLRFIRRRHMLNTQNPKFPQKSKWNEIYIHLVTKHHILESMT